MKQNKRKVFAVVFAIGTIFFNTIASAETNRPPQVEPIRAQLFAPETYYFVQAMDSDNDPLFYSWQGDISCGTFTAGTGASASWSHPNIDLPKGCPHDQGINHIGTINVQVSDGKNHTIVCTYEGSESGNGPLCTMINVPTNSFFGDYVNNKEDSSSYSYTTNTNTAVNYKYKYPSNNGWLFILGVVGVLWWWIAHNGLFVKDANSPDNKKDQTPDLSNNIVE